MTRYIGKQPAFGNFVKLDAISVVNGQAAYTMQSGSSNFTNYDNVNQFIVSLNGVIQAPTDSFTVSGSTITFASALSTGDVINFILVLGDVLSIGTPSDNTISTAKLQDNAVTTAKITDANITTAKIADDAVDKDKVNLISTSSSAGLEVKGDGTTDGYLQLNCSQNSHGVKLKSPNHASSQSYTLTLPATAPATDKILQTDSSGNLSFVDAASGGAISTHFATINGNNNTTSTSYQSVGSGLSITMTPASTSSKIILLSTLNVYGNYIHASFFRGSTNLATDNTSATERIIHNGTGNWMNDSMVFLDAPNTTSSITYEVKYRSSNGATVYVGDGTAILNTLIAIEL